MCRHCAAAAPLEREVSLWVSGISPEGRATHCDGLAAAVVQLVARARTRRVENRANVSICAVEREIKRGISLSVPWNDVLLQLRGSFTTTVPGGTPPAVPPIGRPDYGPGGEPEIPSKKISSLLSPGRRSEATAQLRPRMV